MKRTITLVFAALFSIFQATILIGQNTDNKLIISGRIVSNKNQPLPYTTIYVINHQSGTISNEDGFYTINAQKFSAEDSVRFQYIGYQEKRFTVGQLLAEPNIVLTEKVNQLSELTVFGLPPDPVTIIKQVLKNAEQNYSKQPFKKQLFVRERSYQNITNINIDYKKSSIKEVDPQLFKQIEEKVPKFMTWYTDFLGDVYRSEVTEDIEDAEFKANPERVVSLKQEDVTDLENVEKVFTELARNTEEGQYWKVKTGILSTKIDLDVEDSTNATPEGEQKLKYFVHTLKKGFLFSSFENEDQWEFLHKPSKYDYSLIGGSTYKGENVYIIEFEPKKGGTYEGRVYIASETFALVRADYNYASGKTGTDISILGVNYTQSGFEASINYEKIDGAYHLSYFSKRETQAYGVDRKLSLIKKQERFLWDKELEEIKLNLNLSMEDETSIEVFAFSNKNITTQQFNSFEQPEYMKVIYVEQFNDQLWDGYSIIEPTKQMRNYKKATH